MDHFNPLHAVENVLTKRDVKCVTAMHCCASFFKIHLIASAHSLASSKLRQKCKHKPLLFQKDFVCSFQLLHFPFVKAIVCV